MKDLATDRIASFLESLRALAPVVASRREAFDRYRRLPDDVFAALADVGLFRLWLPRTLGGPELSPLDFLEVVEAAAALDGSIGWLVGNGGGMSRAGGYLPPEVARCVFADPRAFVVSATGAVGTLEPAANGWRVSGRWPFGSGAAHATHFMGLAAIGGEPGPDRPAVFCYFPRAQVTVHDTWHVSGLRGSGSSDWEVRDVFVRAEEAHPFLGHAPTDPGLLYRMPPISVFAWTVAVVPLGIARGALDAFASLAGGKIRLGTTTVLRDRETIQAMVGRAEATMRSARAFLAAAMTELMAATDIGGERLVRARASLRLAAAHAAEA
ncbi:MAG: acyl-CoA dehydrogenase family protein, partial [Rhodobacteraceae bacterium]|nr:acyl-CoA dehydrogenase family protein [Paracoccaceae bacterium]